MITIDLSDLKKFNKTRLPDGKFFYKIVDAQEETTSKGTPAVRIKVSALFLTEPAELFIPCKTYKFRMLLEACNLYDGGSGVRTYDVNRIIGNEVLIDTENVTSMKTDHMGNEKKVTFTEINGIYSMTSPEAKQILESKTEDEGSEDRNDGIPF
jgi:hypothetical protein